MWGNYRFAACEVDMSAEAEGCAEVLVLKENAFQFIERKFSAVVFLIAVTASQIASVKNMPLEYVFDFLHFLTSFVKIITFNRIFVNNLIGGISQIIDIITAECYNLIKK